MIVVTGNVDDFSHPGRFAGISFLSKRIGEKAARAKDWVSKRLGEQKTGQMLGRYWAVPFSMALPYPSG